MKEEFISERIAELRTIKKISAREMSLSLGQNENYINHIENRKAFPSMQGFLLICDYLEISPMEFFDNDSENPFVDGELAIQIKKLDAKAREGLLYFLKSITD